MSGWTRQTDRRRRGRRRGAEGGGRLMERGSGVGRSSGGRVGEREGMRVTEVKRKGWTARCADITRSRPPSRRRWWRVGRWV